MSAGPDEVAVFHGVTLARYAAVRAALAEPFVLRRVLAVEGLDVADYRRADVEWKKRLVRDQDRLLALYRAELEAAEDWLLRIVSPLHQDIEAWVDFLCAFTRHPADVLRVSGLGMNDFSRLTRFWATQAKRDGSLAERAERRMKRGVPQIPKIAADPRQLRRSRAAGTSDRGPAREPPAPQRGDSASRSMVNEPVVEVAPAVQVATPSYAREGASTGRGGAPLPSFLAAQIEAAALARAVAASAPAAVRDGDTTQDVAAFLAPSPAVPFAKPKAPVQDSGETQDVGALLSGPAVPFAAPTQQAPSAVAPKASPAPPRAQNAESTQDISALLAGPAVPFAKPKAPAQDGERTQDISALLSGPAVPFAKPKAPAQDGERTQDISALLAGPAVPKPKAPVQDGERTQDIGALLSGPAVPFAALAPVPAAPAPAPAAPSAPATAADMSLRQYASLCVDIGNRPQQIAEILAGYRLSPEAKQALDARYRDRFMKDPAMFGAFRQACDAYQAWLTEQRQRG